MEKRSRLLLDLLDQQGYGQGIARGVHQYLSLHPEWTPAKCCAEDTHRMKQGTVVGAIGHFIREQQWKGLQNGKVPYAVGVSDSGEDHWWFKVIPDNVAVGAMAADYFIKKGFHYFAIPELAAFGYAIHRIEGFLGRLKKEGITHVERISRNKLDTFHPDRSRLPLAVFIPSDWAAQSIMNWFQYVGLDIPEEVAILGVDNDPLVAPYCPVPLSSVELPLERIGFQACVHLKEMCEQGQQERGRCLFPPVGVVERESTALAELKDARLTQAQAYMEQHLASLGGLEEVAETVHMSRRNLGRLFSRHLGVSPSEWLLRQRVDYARKLLKETDYTVDHVASLSGLEERRRLYRAFEKTGSPLPSVIRADPSCG